MAIDTSALSGWELTAECAEKAGWYLLPRQREDRQIQGIPPGQRRWDYVPAYHQSLDACFRDLVTTLREKGWRYRLEYGGEGFHVAEFATWDGDGWHGHTVTGDTAATALCRAFLAAMSKEDTG